MDLQSRERGEYAIHILTATRPPDNYNGLRFNYKPLVVDDIDRCFKLMCFPNVQIDACSMTTYDPSGVAFTPPTAPQEVQQDECVCDSLV